MEENIVYIPYGLEEINQLEFLEAAANDVLNYVNSRAWSKKRKLAFIDAYSDLMSKGITGASIDNSGFWSVNHSGSIDLDSMPKMNREMYGAAALYIKSKMEGASKKSKKVEEENVNLPKFDNTTLFHNYLGNNYYGGRDIDIVNGWNTLDERDSTTGKLSTTERTKRMIEVLLKYKESLLDLKFDFKDTPFKDITDVNNRIDNAISALQSGDSKKAADALNKIGIQYNLWFSNGLGDASGYTDTNGNSLTYGQLAELNKLEAERKLAELLAALTAQKLKQYQNKIFIVAGTSSKMTGKSPIELKEKYGDLNLLLAALGGYAQRGLKDLTPEEQSEVHGIYKNLAKENIDSNTLKVLLSMSSGRYKGAAPNRFKKINGINNLVYDSIANLVILLGNRDLLNLPTTGIDLFEGVKNKQELMLEASNRKLDNGWETEDYLRMGAMALDIAGGIAAWTGPYGMAASGILGLTSLGTNMAADIADESLTGLDVAKNTGVNLGLAAVGMVPGLGLASKTGKWLTNIAKWAPRLLTLQAIKDLPESYNSLLKAINNPKELTNSDWKNIAYGLSVVAGLSRGTKGIINNRKFKPTVTQETQTETYITTKSGKQIKATKELVEAINKAGRKGGNDKANEELRKLPGALNEEVNINFKTGIKGKADPTNKIKLESSTKNIGLSPEVLRYSRALSIKNIRDKAKHPLLSKYLPTDYDIYLSAAKVSVPNINAIDKIKQIWNPIPNRPFKGTKQNNNPQNPSNPSNLGTKTNTGSNAKPKQPILSKKDSDELLSTLRGKNFSTNEFKDESRVVGSIKGFGDLYGIRNTDGTHTLQIDFGGTRVNVTGTKADIKSKTLEVLKKDVMKKIDNLIPKENRSRIKFELIKQLKLNGYLKQGGIIVTKDNIAEILKDIEL